MGWYDDKIGLNFLRDRRDLLFEIDALAKDSKAPRIFLPRPIAYGEQPRFCEQTLLLALSIGIRPACVGARVRFTVNVDQEEVGVEPLGKTNGRVDRFRRIRGQINGYNDSAEANRIPGQEGSASWCTYLSRQSHRIVSSQFDTKVLGLARLTPCWFKSNLGWHRAIFQIENGDVPGACVETL